MAVVCAAAAIGATVASAHATAARTHRRTTDLPGCCMGDLSLSCSAGSLIIRENSSRWSVLRCRLVGVPVPRRPFAGLPTSVAACLGVICVLSGDPGAASAPQQALDPILAAYTTGDQDVVARTLLTSNDFRKLRILDGRRLERWLGA